MSAIYMFKITGEKKYTRQVETLYSELNPITPWAADGFEGDIAPTLLYFSRMGGVSREFKSRIRRDYQNILTGDNGVMHGVERAEHAYVAPMNSYNWGSNSTAARRGSVFTQAAQANMITQAAQANMTGPSKTDFKNAGAGYLHYLHGVNPQGLVYLSNMESYGAEKSVSEFYHAWFVNGSADYDSILSPPTGQPPMKSYAEFNDGWPLNSWSVTENSNGYQIDYIRLLSKYAR